MNILFLTDNFPPESNAPASRTFEHAKQWVADGHRVTVITCAPNFPAGKLFAGYRNRWYQSEILDGIKVVRVKTYITANEGFVKRTLDYLSFMMMATIASLFQSKPDVIVATSPQFFTAIAGYLVSRCRRTPFVFELRDMWPASIAAVGAMTDGIAIRMLTRLELFLYRKAACVVSVTQSFKNELIERGVPESKICVVLNGVDLTQYRPTDKQPTLLDELDLHGRFVIGYIGTHGMAHGLPKVVEAAAQLQSEKEIVFLFAGGGAERQALESDVRARGLNNVRLLPMQPKARMPQIWSICDVALIPLRNQPLFCSVIPSKLFECMGMGIPVIMSIPPGEATRIVEKTHCGLVVPPEEPNALVEAAMRLKSDPGLLAELRENAIKYAPHYSRNNAAKSMLSCLKSASHTP